MKRSHRHAYWRGSQLGKELLAYVTPALPDASEQLPVEPEAQESELLLGEHPVEPTLETQDRQAPAPVETGLIASPSAVPADISLEEPAFGHLTPIAGEEPQQPAVQEEEPVTEITEPALSLSETIAGLESQPPVGPTDVQLVGKASCTGNLRS